MNQEQKTERCCCCAEGIQRLTMRPEEAADHDVVEALIREAFWNVYCPGADAHYLLHMLRKSPAYLPDLHILAMDADEPVGSAVYSRAYVVAPEQDPVEVLTLGPLGVRPDWQKQGVGSMLMGYSLAVAKHRGERAVLLMGSPQYYGRFGFCPASSFGLTLSDGTAPDAFMALELYPDALSRVRGTWQSDPAFDNQPPEALAAYDARFPHKEKLVLPGQLH